MALSGQLGFGNQVTLELSLELGQNGFQQAIHLGNRSLEG